MLSTWEVSFAEIERQSPVAAGLLSLLGLINLDDIFPELFKFSSAFQFAGKQTEDMDSIHWWESLSAPGTAFDEYKLETALSVLQAYSLVSWRLDQASYSMHEMVHTWAYERLTESQRRTWAFVALKLLRQFTNGWKDNLRMNVRVVPHTLALLRALVAVSGPIKRMTSRQLESISMLGDMLYGLGYWNHAGSLSEFLRCQLKATYGIEHLDTLLSMTSLATTLANEGQYKQAEVSQR